MDDLLKRVEAALAGRYEIESELGRGGMAVVYRGRDLRHERDVAIKVLPPHLASAIGHERFLHEIKLAAGLAHPYVVPILDSGEADGLLYYTMPVVGGETLQDRLTRDGPLSIDEARTIAGEVAEALAHAHGAGVLHRDVKPSNILLTRDHALLSDFGVARAAEASDDERLTGTGVIIGTPAYMSPQQALSEDGLDASADQYSLGCVLYEMLAGRVPFCGTSARAMLVDHATREPTPLRELRPEIPAPLAAVVERAMAKHPEDRFPSIEAFREALRTSAPGAATANTVGSGTAEAPGPSALRRAAAVVLLGLGAAGGTWALASLYADGDSNDAAIEPASSGHRVAILPCQVAPALGADADSLGFHTAHQLWTWLERIPELAPLPWERLDGVEPPPLDSLETAARRLGVHSLVRCSLGPARGDSVVLEYDTWTDGRRGLSGRATLERMSSGVVDTRPVAGELPTILTGVPLSGEGPFALTDDDLAFERFSLGTRAFLEGRFFEAETLFAAAHRIDTAFVLARWRAADARRWHLQPAVETVPLSRLYADHRGDLGRRNALYLSAAALPPGPKAFSRFETILREIPNDAYAHLLYGDELLHRGPLFGLGLDAAEEQLRQAVTLNPRLSPAWNHLAVVLMRRGDEAAADSALAGLRKAAPDGEADATYALWRHAWRERFRPTEAAAHRAALFSDPAGLPVYARYGVRLFDLPDLQLLLGIRLASGADRGSETWHSGTNAAALAHASRGRPGPASELWRIAATSAPPPSRAAALLFSDVWTVIPVALGLEGFPPGDDASAPEEAAARLERIASDTSAAPLHRVRAAWALARYAARAEVGVEVDAFDRHRRTVRSLTEAHGLDPRLLRHLEAVAAAREGSWRDALELSASLIVYDSVGNLERPFGRAALYLDRGRWFAELARDEDEPVLADSALATWIWHLNTDLEGVPGREVQAGEVDAAFGTHARLRIARLAGDPARGGASTPGRDQDRWRDVACEESREVRRRWRASEPSLARVVREMEEMADRLRCPGASP